MKAGGDFFFIQSLFAQIQNCPKLIERVQLNAVEVFGKRVFYLKGFSTADNAGNAYRLRELFLTDQ